MTLADILVELRDLERMFDDCIVVTRIIIDPDGKEVGRFSRVSLTKKLIAQNRK